MNEKEVIELASDFAEQKGYDISQYNLTAKREKREWIVRFQGKELRPGNFFTIYVDDKTKSVKQLFPGK
jgi:hypothetical protein